MNTTIPPHADQLHYHPAAYVAFTDVIKPVVSAAWAEVASSH